MRQSSSLMLTRLPTPRTEASWRDSSLVFVKTQFVATRAARSQSSTWVGNVPQGFTIASTFLSVERSNSVTGEQCPLFFETEDET